MNTEEDPINIHSREGGRLKALASTTCDAGLFAQAADQFRQSGLLAEERLNDPNTDDICREACTIWSPYHYYEQYHCLAWQFYELHNIPESRRHLNKAGEYLIVHKTQLESMIRSGDSSKLAKWQPTLDKIPFYQAANAIIFESLTARAAWDDEQFIAALDCYRRMFGMYDKVIELAKTQDDRSFERISLGNKICMAANASSAMLGHHLKLAGCSEEDAKTVVPQDLASDILRHAFGAYRHCNAACDINPEQLQYRKLRMICRRNVEQFLADNLDSWEAIYTEFLNDHEFHTIMAGLDLKRFKAIANNGSGTQLTKPNKIKILFMAACPEEEGRLRLDEEIRTIQERLRMSKHSDLFEICQEWAVRMTDLQGVLLRHEPHVVHFSGHGGEGGAIILEDIQGQSYPVPPAALANLFKVLDGGIQGVVLNSCGSLPQAEAIKEHVSFVIGMSDSIDDSSAISFAANFYQALGFGKNVKAAFDLGCNQIDLAKLPGKDLPTLLTRDDADPTMITLAFGTPLGTAIS